MKKRVLQGLMVGSVVMFLGCEDPVSDNPGTAPEILSIEANKTEFTVNSGDITSTENTTITLKIKDAEKNLSKIRMINMGQVQDLAWSGGMSSTEIEALLQMQIPVGTEQNITVSYIAIDSKGNESDTSKLTFTIADENINLSNELKVVNNSDSKITFHFNGNTYPLVPNTETSLISNASNEFINDIFTYTTRFEYPTYVNDLVLDSPLEVEVDALTGNLDFSQSGQKRTITYNSTFVEKEEYDTAFTNANKTSWNFIDTSSTAQYSIGAISTVDN